MVKLKFALTSIAIQELPFDIAFKNRPEIIILNLISSGIIVKLYLINGLIDYIWKIQDNLPVSSLRTNILLIAS